MRSSSNAFARRRRPRRATAVLLVAVAVAALSLGVGVAARRAATASPRRACLVHPEGAQVEVGGYVWADAPTSEAYAPDGARQCNSQGGTNTVTRRSAGLYLVRFPGLAVDGGTIEVAGVDPEDRICTGVDWRPTVDRAAENVQVACFGRDGHPADAAFVLSFTFRRGYSGPLAYVHADAPSTGSYTPPTNYQFNSLGGAIGVNRHREGRYLVLIPKMDRPLTYGNGGAVTVTAIGREPAICTPVQWAPSEDEGKLGVEVACHDRDGRAKDQAFTLSFTIDLGSTPEADVPGAYVWAEHGDRRSYDPHMDYQYNSTGAMNTVVRDAPGDYLVLVPGLTDEGGVVMAGAYDSTASCAAIARVATREGQRIRVLCRSPAGQPVDAKFTVQYRQ